MIPRQPMASVCRSDIRISRKSPRTPKTLFARPGAVRPSFNIEWPPEKGTTNAQYLTFPTRRRCVRHKLSETPNYPTSMRSMPLSEHVRTRASVISPHLWGGHSLAEETACDGVALQSWAIYLEVKEGAEIPSLAVGLSRIGRIASSRYARIPCLSFQTSPLAPPCD